MVFNCCRWENEWTFSSTEWGWHQGPSCVMWSKIVCRQPSSEVNDLETWVLPKPEAVFLGQIEVRSEKCLLHVRRIVPAGCFRALAEFGLNHLDTTDKASQMWHLQGVWGGQFPFSELEDKLWPGWPSVSTDCQRDCVSSWKYSSFLFIDLHNIQWRRTDSWWRGKSSVCTPGLFLLTCQTTWVHN